MPLWGAVALSLAALALFSACEAALTSLTRIRLRHWAGKQISGRAAQELLERPGRLIMTLFVGANLATVCLGVSATLLLARWLGFVQTSPVPGALAAAALATLPAVLLGEVLPRAIVREYPGALLPGLVAGGRLLSYLFWPYILVMNAAAALLFRVLGIPPRAQERAFTRGSIESLLREGEREGVVDRHEREIIGGIFAFGETPVREVMTPRPDVVAVQLGSSREALARLIWETGYSRFPVTDGSPENIVGIIHAVDVLKARDGERLRPRPTLFVPETITCEKLLYAMRRQRIQLAVAVDEYGGVAGIVTLEDLVEELVGEIRDEHDREPAPAPSEPGEGVVLPARTPLAEVAERFALSLLPEEERETIAGHLLRRLGRVPIAGEQVELRGLTLEVVEASPTRVLRVWAAAPPGEEEGPEPELQPRGGDRRGIGAERGEPPDTRGGEAGAGGSPGE